MTPSPAGSPDALPAPGLLRRFAAMLYDSLLLFAVGWTVTAVAVGLRAALSLIHISEPTRPY